MTNKQAFKAFCEERTDLVIFETYDWINTIAANHNWNVLLSKDKGGNIVGYWIIFHKKRGPFLKVTLPPLTPYLGPRVLYPEGIKDSKKSSLEKQVLNELMDQLPKYDQIIFHTSPLVTNWLPFFWKGFSQTTRYTYTLTPRDTEQSFKALRSNIRREIKKGDKSLTIKQVEEIDSLHKLKLLDYEAKGIPVPYSQEYFQAVVSLCQEKNCSLILNAYTENGALAGSMFFMWDEHFFYYLVGATDPAYRNSGAMSLLMWKGIEEAAKRNLTFNFEGSMIEGIQRFFSSFGSEQTPYFRIYQTPNKLLELINNIRGK